MRQAFTTKSDGWKSLLRKQNDSQKAALIREREGERLALLDWIQFGHPEDAYQNNSYKLSAYLAQQPITAEFLVKDAADNPLEPRHVAIKTLIEKRCVDCHIEGGRFPEAG